MSLIAERLLDHLGQGRFKGYSAGLYSAGLVNPLALNLLISKGLSIENLHSKNVQELIGENAPRIDFIFTVCADSAGEWLPTEWQQAEIAHLMLVNPANVAGTLAQKEQAYNACYEKLYEVLSDFVARTLRRDGA